MSNCGRKQRNRIECYVSVDEIEPNVLLIKPFHGLGFESDSVYEFKLPLLRATNGTFMQPTKVTFISKPKIMYASLADIRNKLGAIDISDEVILYHIKEASRLAEVVVQKAYEKHSMNFGKEHLTELRNSVEDIKDNHNLIWNFVVYKAAYESLSTLYVCMVTKPDRLKEVLSDLHKEFHFDLKAIKDLLDDFKHNFEDILRMIITFADPKSALRGRTAMPIDLDFGAPFYRLNGTQGYNRAYNNFSSTYGRRF